MTKQQRDCESKTRYRKLADASRQANLVNEISLNGRQRPYKCPICKRWHLTTIKEQRE